MTACAPGTFAAAAGAATCDACPAGHFSKSGGCAAGDVCGAGITACEPCPAGTYLLPVSTLTSRCTPEDERFRERFCSDFEISCRDEHR